jgi:hypothetical protein
MTTSQQATALKLREAMSGLRACVPKATAEERRTIVASLNDLREIYTAVTAMEDIIEEPVMDLPLELEDAALPGLEGDELGEEVPLCGQEDPLMDGDHVDGLEDQDVVTFVPSDGMDEDEELAVHGLALAAKALRALSAAEGDEEPPMDDLPADDEPAAEGGEEDFAEGGEELPAEEGECGCPPAGDTEILSEDDLAELEEAGIIEARARPAKRSAAVRPAPASKPAASPTSKLRSQLRAASARLDVALGAKKKPQGSPVKRPTSAASPKKPTTRTTTSATRR